MSLKKNSEKKKSVIISAIYLAMGTLSSRGLGLIRDMAMSAFLPMDLRDAYSAAFRLPALFRRLLGEGALSATFLPLYVKADQAGHIKERDDLSSGVFSLLVTVATLITLTLIIFMDDVIPMWVSGEAYTSVPGKIESTILLARGVFPFLLLMTIFALFMNLHNAHGKFFLTGFAPCLFNLAMIVYLPFKDLLPFKVEIGMSLAIVIGGVLQILVLVPFVVRKKIVPRFILQPWKVKGVLKVLKTFVPSLLGVGVLQLTVLVNTFFASQISRGAVYHIYLADRLLELPLSLIAVSLGAALLPEFSRLVGSGETEKMKGTLAKHWVQGFIIAVPCAFGLFAISDGIVELLFKRGEFSIEEVASVSSIVKVYSFSLIIACAHRLFIPGFYAVSDTLTPALCGLAGLILHVICAKPLMLMYGVQGLTISTTIGTSCNLILVMLFFTRRFGSLQWKPVLLSMSKIFLASMIMGIVSFYLYDFILAKVGSVFIAVVATMLVSALIYFTQIYFSNLSEAEVLINKIRSKVTRSR